MTLQNMFSKVRFLNASSFSEERWRRIRAKGKTRFVFLRGVFGFGGLMIAVDLLFIGPHGLMPTAHNVEKWVVALFFGFLFGMGAWHTLENRFPGSTPVVSKKINIG